jgi:hypothetical protein
MTECRHKTGDQGLAIFALHHSKTYIIERIEVGKICRFYIEIISAEYKTEIYIKMYIIPNVE